MANPEAMTIAVVGATGVLGRAVVPRLLARGHSVRAQVRGADRARGLKALGAEAVQADILDRDSLDALVDGADAALHLATAIPKAGGPADWSLNDRIRTEGTANLVAACEAAKVERYVQQSIAMVHMPGGDRMLNEDAPKHPNPVTASAIEMEAMVEAADIDWRILRGGAFYGPGTGREEAWAEAAREGRLQVPGDGRDYISLIHVGDMASATVAATESPEGRISHMIVDYRPVTYRELFGTLAAVIGAPPPKPGGPTGLASFRCSNWRACRILDWAPAYPDYRAGLARLM